MRKSRSRTSLARPVAAVCCALAMLPVGGTNQAHATVFEYDKAGLAVGNSASGTSATPAAKRRHTVQNKDAKSSDLRTLARSIATEYSSSEGVKASGLSALDFVDIFQFLIERESRFDPKAISPKGAKGLGQLMPGTASDLGVVDAFDPKANLHGSARYLTTQLERFGRIDLALAAYNAGPERVRQYNGIPPFAETEAYVSWILDKAGVPLELPEQATNSDATISALAKPTSTITDTDQPLTGDVSVWEF